MTLSIPWPAVIDYIKANMQFEGEGGQAVIVTQLHQYILLRTHRIPGSWVTVPSNGGDCNRLYSINNFPWKSMLA
jgi:hypothetical protein